MYQNSGLSYKGSRVQIPPARPNSNDSKVLGLGIICIPRPFDTYLHIFGASLVLHVSLHLPTVSS